jgi:hypothetical protein
MEPEGSLPRYKTSPPPVQTGTPVPNHTVQCHSPSSAKALNLSCVLHTPTTSQLLQPAVTSASLTSEHSPHHPLLPPLHPNTALITHFSNALSL